MTDEVMAFGSVDELAGYVHRELCDRHALDPAQTPLYRTPLVRAGRPAGAVFHVDGPRRLRPSAVWAADAGRVIFYDPLGGRAGEVALADGPAVPESPPPAVDNGRIMM